MRSIYVIPLAVLASMSFGFVSARVWVRERNPKSESWKKKEKKSICQPHAQLRMEQDLLTQAPKSRNEVANRQKSKAKEFILGKIKTTKAQIRHTCPSGDGSDGGGPKWHARRAHFNGQQRLLSVKVGILFSPRPIRTDHRNRDLQYL